MRLAELINRIKSVALSQPDIKMVVDNDVFRLNSIPHAKYGVFAYVQGQHSASIDSPFVTYQFTFFYVDRLTENGSNEVEIQSVGCDTLSNIIRTLAEEMGIDSWSMTPFNQRFHDICAGAFCNVSIDIPVDYGCADTI